MFLWKCELRDSKKTKFIKKEEARGLLSNLGIKTLLRKIPLVGVFFLFFCCFFLFCFKSFKQVNTIYRMNEIVNKILLAEEKFIPEIHLRQPGFTYSPCGPFRQKKERIQKFKETGDSGHIYQNKLDKACCQHGMAYGGFKYSTRGTASVKILYDKAFNIAEN